MWDGALCLKNIWMTNSHANSTKVMVSDIRIIIAYLESQLNMTKIVLKSEKEESFLTKSIDIELYSCSRIESCLNDS